MGNEMRIIKNRALFWVLDELDPRTPIPQKSIAAWGGWMDQADRCVLRDVVGDYLISTVFLGFDYNPYVENPVLWETMIFKNDHKYNKEFYRELYDSYDSARSGHETAMKWLSNFMSVRKDE